MSEVQKPVEAPVAAVEAPVVAEPVAETKAVEAAEPVVETPATTEEVAAATETAPAVVEAPKEFSGEGVLGYKAPGGFLKKLAGFQKKHFWFQDEPVEAKHLSSYIRGEKVDVANHNAAWASQSGKGLLFFSKHASEKTSPAGLINLADITDLSEDGTTEFYFVYQSAKHVFQATTLSERDSWVSALKTKSTEAKESAETVKSSEGYKKELELISKPLVVAGAAVGAADAAKKVEVKKEEKAEAKVEKKDEEAAVKEDKKEEKKEEKTRKERSVSRKRNSIFGSFLNKKEDKVEAAEPVPALPTETAAATTETVPAATEPATTEVAPLDGPAVAAAVVAAPVEETKATEASTDATRPVATNKRNSSIFSNLQARFAKKTPVSEDSPAVPAKDETVVAEPVSTEAPVIPAPEATSTEAAVVPAETAEVAAAPAVVEEAKPTTKADKRKSSLPFGLGQKKEKTGSDSEGEKPLSPFAKLRQTVKGKKAEKAEKAPVVDEKAVAVEPATAEVKATGPEAAAVEPSAPVVEEAAEPKVVSAPVPVVAAAAPQVSATA